MGVNFESAIEHREDARSPQVAVPGVIEGLGRRLTGRFGLHRVGSNFLWLAAEKLVRLVFGLGVGILVARHLGPEGFGLLSFALAIASLVMVIPDFGLDSLLKRELIAAPESAPALLKTATAIRFGLGALVYLTLSLVVAGLYGNAKGADAIFVTGLLVFQPAGMCVAMWYHARLQAKTVVVAQLLGLVLASIMRLWFVFSGAGVLAFAWCAIIEAGVTAVILLRVFTSGRDCPGGSLSPNRRGRISLSEAWPLALSALAVVMYMRIDTVMLNVMRGDVEVGYYSAAARVSEVFYAVPVAVASSLMPSLMEARNEGRAEYRDRLQSFFNLSAVFALLCAAPVSIGAPMLVSVAYGKAYEPSVAILMIHAWACVFVFLGIARGQWLVIEGRTRFYLMATLLGAVTNVLLNIVLIPLFGGIGAAVATVLSYGVSAWGSSFLSAETRQIGFMQLSAMLFPLLFWRRKPSSVS